MNYEPAYGKANIVDAVKRGEIYLTFVFDGKDSSQLGVVSVSNGSTYDTPILPAFSNNFLEVDGYDGSFYFNTRIPKKTFTYECFIDNLSAQDFEQLKTWLAPKRVAKLVRPEEPYVYYWAKVDTISNLGNIPLSHPDTGGVSYTGNFSVSFTTVGQSCGYGLCYYKDDLKYYEYRDLMTDMGPYYDSGLLYKENMPSSTATYGNGEHKVILYNPGTFTSKLVMNISIPKSITAGSLTIINDSTGDVSVINLKGVSAGAKIRLDWEKNEYFINEDDFSQNVSGDLMFLSSRELVETYENGFISNNGKNSTLYFDEKVRVVRTEDIGKTTMFSSDSGDTSGIGLGAKIIGIDSKTNTFILEPSIGLLGNYTTVVNITKLNDIRLKATLPSDRVVDINWTICPRYS